MSIPVAAAPRPTGVLVASTLCWIWGILGAIGAIGLFVAASSVPGLAPLGTIAAAVLAVLAVAYMVAGSLIRKGLAVGAWIGVITSGIVAVLQLLGLASGSRLQLSAIMGCVLNLSIFVLIILNWRYFRPASADAPLAPPQTF
jgi:hypothetical protein